MVDVGGLEPPSPCLQRRERKSISLVRLALFCVAVPSSGPNSAAIGPKLTQFFFSILFLYANHWFVAAEGHIVVLVAKRPLELQAERDLQAAGRTGIN